MDPVLLRNREGCVEQSGAMEFSSWKVAHEWINFSSSRSDPELLR